MKAPTEAAFSLTRRRTRVLIISAALVPCYGRRNVVYFTSILLAIPCAWAAIARSDHVWRSQLERALHCQSSAERVQCPAFWKPAQSLGFPLLDTVMCAPAPFPREISALTNSKTASDGVPPHLQRVASQ